MFYLFFRNPSFGGVNLPISSRRGGRAKMTEATQTTFFGDFFGKEMSENSGLANQLTTEVQSSCSARAVLDGTAVGSIAKPLGVSFGIVWVT